MWFLNSTKEEANQTYSDLREDVDIKFSREE